MKKRSLFDRGLDNLPELCPPKVIFKMNKKMKKRYARKMQDEIDTIVKKRNQEKLAKVTRIKLKPMQKSRSHAVLAPKSSTKPDLPASQLVKSKVEDVAQNIVINEAAIKSVSELSVYQKLDPSKRHSLRGPDQESSLLGLKKSYSQSTNTLPKSIDPRQYKLLLEVRGSEKMQICVSVERMDDSQVPIYKTELTQLQPHVKKELLIKFDLEEEETRDVILIFSTDNEKYSTKSMLICSFHQKRSTSIISMKRFWRKALSITCLNLL